MIDLNKCKRGYKMGTGHGAVLTYVKLIPNSTHPHRVRYSNGDLRDLTSEDGEKLFKHEPYSCEPEYKFLIW